MSANRPTAYHRASAPRVVDDVAWPSGWRTLGLLSPNARRVSTRSSGAND
jgi:hypothetical protein